MNRFKIEVEMCNMAQSKVVIPDVFVGQVLLVWESGHLIASHELAVFIIIWIRRPKSQLLIGSMVLSEGLKDVRNIGLTNSKFGLEMTYYSSSEHNFMKATHEGPVEILSNVNPNGNYEPIAQLISGHESIKHICSKEPMLAHGLDATCASLPPSFIALLFDSCPQAEEEPLKQPDSFYLNTQTSHMLQSDPHGTIVEEACRRAKISASQAKEAEYAEERGSR
ncbi:hypothetical protein GH714_040663 [Hevea brasiliensis]|uniref:Uncharacterized protein n=1 Tax=Hevea brasiliensis TaxID=3981 RepID=A0A6A6KZ78_HEVBR|nr:hypothetical protein GH714_040663 [Hevea brasiliensis]